MLGVGPAGAGHAESWGGNEVARWKQGRSQLLLVIKWVFLAWFLELRSPHVLLVVDVFPCHFLFHVQEVWGLQCLHGAVGCAPSQGLLLRVSLPCSRDRDGDGNSQAERHEATPQSLAPCTASCVCPKPFAPLHCC